MLPWAYVIDDKNNPCFEFQILADDKRTVILIRFKELEETTSLYIRSLSENNVIVSLTLPAFGIAQLVDLQFKKVFVYIRYKLQPNDAYDLQLFKMNEIGSNNAILDLPIFADFQNHPQ